MESSLEVLSRAATMIQNNNMQTKQLPTTKWRRERRARLSCPPGPAAVAWHTPHAHGPQESPSDLSRDHFSDDSADMDREPLMHAPPPPLPPHPDYAPIEYTRVDIASIREHPELLRDHPELIRHHPELLRYYPNLLREHPELIKLYPDLLQHYPELIIDQPELVKQYPDLLRHYPELFIDQPELVKQYPDLLRHYLELIRDQPELLKHYMDLLRHYPELIDDHPELVKRYTDFLRHYPELIRDCPELIKHFPDLIHEHPGLIGHYPELIRDNPDLIMHYPDLIRDHPDLLKQYPELIRDHPELLKYCPDLLREHPELIREHPDLIRYYPEAVQDYPELMRPYPAAAAAAAVREHPDLVREHTEQAMSSRHHLCVGERVPVVAQAHPAHQDIGRAFSSPHRPFALDPMASSLETERPLDMRVPRVNRGSPPSYSQAVASNALHRPSVITHSAMRSLSMCDPIIEEHFRRSLGSDYEQYLCSPQAAGRQLSTPQPSGALQRSKTISSYPMGSGGGGKALKYCSESPRRTPAPPPPLYRASPEPEYDPEPQLECEPDSALSVDDHFTKALGDDTWRKIKAGQPPAHK